MFEKISAYELKIIYNGNIDILLCANKKLLKDVFVRKQV